MGMGIVATCIGPYNMVVEVPYTIAPDPSR